MTWHNDDEATPKFKTKEERDEWQKRHHGHIRNGFREQGTLDDGRSIINRGEEFEYLPAVRAYYAAKKAGEARWICPGCAYNYGLETKTCASCNRDEEARWVKASRAIHDEMAKSGAVLKPSQLLTEIAALATGIKGPHVIAKPMPEAKPEEPEYPF